MVTHFTNNNLYIVLQFSKHEMRLMQSGVLSQCCFHLREV